MYERNFGNRYAHGLRVSTHNNATAYGYSITITAAFGILSTIRGTPGILEIFAFAAGAVVAFALVGAIASSGFRHRLEDEPSDIKTLGGSLAFLSVGLGLVGPLAAGQLSVALGGWLLGAFLATVVYLGLVPLEMILAELLEERRTGAS
jgi:hypothetical protein